MASVRILGPVEVWAGGRRLALGGPRQLALLAFLVVHANRAVSADAIIDALWGASRPASASTLQMAIARLRKALEPLQSGDGQWLQTVSGGYLLAIESEELDADVFAAGDDALIGGALARLSSYLPSGERRAMLERAAVLLMRAGDDRELATAYNNAAYEDLLEGRIAEARSLLEVAMPAAISAQRPQDMMLSFGNLGLAHLFSGDLPQARKAFEDQLRLCLGHTFRYGADEGLAGMAAVCAGEGRPRHAARLLVAARALGYPPAYDQPIYDRLESDFFEPARTPFGAAEWALSEKDGAALSYDQAIASALR